MTISSPEVRARILARLVSKAPGRKLGRTAAMKLMYFLQELEGVHLGYDFRLYTYGPFDSDVLSDLGAATTRGLLQEKTVLYARGYGYEITLGPQGDRVGEALASEDPDTAQAIDTVVAAFGSLGSAELELRSTILFVARELRQQGATPSVIAERVREIKPHFSQTVILDRVSEFQAKGWLRCLPSRLEAGAS